MKKINQKHSSIKVRISIHLKILIPLKVADRVLFYILSIPILRYTFQLFHSFLTILLLLFHIYHSLHTIPLISLIIFQFQVIRKPTTISHNISYHNVTGPEWCNMNLDNHFSLAMLSTYRNIRWYRLPVMSVAGYRYHVQGCWKLQ